MKNIKNLKNKFPKIKKIDGVEFSVCKASIKKNNELDLLIIKINSKSVITGATTLSKTSSYAVEWCKKNISKKQDKNYPIIFVINSGNANVFTGKEEKHSVDKITNSIVENFNTVESNIFIASTGVIGEVLDYKKITTKIDLLKKNFKPDIYIEAAQSIMTTDTYPKGVSKKIIIDKKEVIINGIAKGSGMIAPNMATMLAFIFTNFPISKNCLQSSINKMLNSTFNSITIDGDTSTSDTLLVTSTGSAKISKIISKNDLRLLVFENALFEVMIDLCKLIVKDGEGASKFIEITVSGTKTNKEAHTICQSIANSPLVKTAFFGEDPNWGRVVMAIGKTNVNIEKNKVSISYGKNLVAENGGLSNKYNEKKIKNYMKKCELELFINIGNGEGKSRMFTSDFSKKYVTINSDYRS